MPILQAVHIHTAQCAPTTNEYSSSNRQHLSSPPPTQRGLHTHIHSPPMATYHACPLYTNSMLIFASDVSAQFSTNAGPSNCTLLSVKKLGAEGPLAACMRTGQCHAAQQWHARKTPQQHTVYSKQARHRKAGSLGPNKSQHD
jgi:hypothetical protein